MLFKLNISIHDITKSNIEMIQDILDILQNIGISKLTFLLIPYYHEKESLLDIKDWLWENIKENEVVLHGYTHQSGRFYDFRDFLTNQEGEFDFYSDIEDRIAKGLDILSSIGYNPEGFIPPAWLIKKKDFNILKKYGFSFTTDRRYIYDLKRDKMIFSPVLSFGGRGFLEEISIFTFNKQIALMKLIKIPIFRVALHPVDVLNEEKMRLLINFLKNNQYEIVSLKESLNLIKS